MQSKDRETWELVKTFYKDRFGIAPDLVEIAMVFDILKMCASGSGTPQIAEFLEMKPEKVAEILDIHFGFTGWDSDQPFSPLKIYKGLDTKDLESFRNAVIMQFGYVDATTIKHLHTAAGLVAKLERLLDEKWI
jgi:hypothetical protein